MEEYNTQFPVFNDKFSQEELMDDSFTRELIRKIIYEYIFDISSTFIDKYFKRFKNEGESHAKRILYLNDIYDFFEKVNNGQRKNKNKQHFETIYDSFTHIKDKSLFETAEDGVVELSQIINAITTILDTLGKDIEWDKIRQ